MKRVTARRLLALFTVGVLVLLFQVFTAGAAPGDGLTTIPTSPPCTDGAAGIGVAFDGNNILYTCAGEAAVHKTDLTGANLGSVATHDGANNPVSVDAIAWDANEGMLWGGDLDGAGNCRIWKIDMGTGLAALQFTFTDPSGFCGSAIFYDGITVDTKTDTLYLSPDINPTIRHFSKAGAPLADDPIPFATLTTGVCGGSCGNSGLAIGIDGVLFAGTNGAGKIVELDPTVPSFLGQFASVSGRDEDLECGPLFTKPDGSVVETILSRDFISGRIDVLEAPPGTCVVFQLGLAPATALNPVGTSHEVTATLTANGSPLAGRTILFSVSGANAGASGSDTSDAAGEATFSYVGTNAGDDTITACADINNNASCDPEEPSATAEKTWFVFAPGGGAFVIGDESSAVGTEVTFWGAQWSKLNSLSGGAAPASFKGFATNPAVPDCGVDWSTDPGNSAPPPAGPLPDVMGVIVTSDASKSGSQISGDTAHIVLVRTDPGYDGNPGHAGTGTVVAQVC
jgi:hypothetical protein